MGRRLLGMAFFMLILLSQLTYADLAQPKKFITISDIHFNPFTLCKMLSLKACPIAKRLQQAKVDDWAQIFQVYAQTDIPNFHHDTNYVLLTSTLHELQTVVKADHIQFMLFLGDALAHNYRAQYILYTHDKSKLGYSQFVAKTLQFLIQQMQAALPQQTIFPVLGNNDSYSGNYKVVPQGIFFRDTMASWAGLIKDEKNRESFKKGFSNSGYYAVVVDKNLKLIVMNTVLFSPLAQDTSVKKAAADQLTWLNNELVLANKNKQRVLIACHIPYGVDVYKTVKSFFHGITEYWNDEYLLSFKKILADYPYTVVAILPGHLHMDGFQVLNLTKTYRIPISYTPSISPIFGNNPSYKIYSYDTVSYQLQNFDTFYYTLDKPQRYRNWQKEYDFDQIYQKRCKNCSLDQGMQALTFDNDLVDFYRDYYAVSNKAQPITKKNGWLPYWCNIYAVTKQDYQTCLKH
jgi:sphingomyelin phosphodiesterase acid-like 3